MNTRKSVLSVVVAVAGVIAIVACGAGPDLWQTSSAQSQAQASQPASQAAPAAQSQPAPANKPFTEGELASLLAPIALYPDTVVTQILMASTYPLEVVQANRWLQQHKDLKGEALAKEAQKQPWDPSVQGLVAIPDVLKMMDEKIDWTQKVGDAFLAQQKEVLDAIQALRRKAQEAGNLKSDDHMKVKTEAAPAPAATSTAAAAPAPQVIVIESASPEVVYVPTYNPVTIYGSWGYPAYPPYYYPPPMGYPAAGFGWGLAVGISIGYWGGGGWGHCYPDWHGGQVNIGEINIGSGNINSGNRGQAQPKGGAGASGKGTSASTRAAGGGGSGGKQWQHNPEHRQGVSYRDSGSQSKFGGASSASAGSRDAYRGRSGSSGSPSAGTRDMGSTSSGMRDLGSTPSASNRGTGSGSAGRDLGSTPSASSRGSSASSRDMGSSASRGSSSSYGGGSSSRGSSSSAFGGMNSGSRASSYGSRGGASRGGGGGRGGRR